MVHRTLAIGIFDLLPKAKTTPIGRDATIPVIAISNVKSNPPQSNVSMGARP